MAALRSRAFPRNPSKTRRPRSPPRPSPETTDHSPEKVPYRFDPTKDLDVELRRIAREQLTRALTELDVLPPAEAIHQARRRCKKLRALLRIVRPGLPDTCAFENAFFRDAANGLSDLRDAAVRIQTFDKLLGMERHPFGAIRRHLTECHRAIAGEDRSEKIRTFRAALQAGLRRVERWTIHGDPAEVVLAGERKTYRRGRRAFATAMVSHDAEDFHDWRKRVKDHGFHTRLLGDLWKPVMKTRCRELDRLGELLGDDHDLVVLRATLLDDPKTFGPPDDLAPFLALVARRQNKLRAKARKLGHRIHSENRESHAKLLRAWWKVS